MKRFALLTLAALAASPAAAQNGSAQGPAEPKVNQLIVYGDDQCPPSTGDEITVCARLDESERYRIPESLRQLDGPQNEAWTNKVRSFETVGDFGPLSCTPTGAGGELGCTAKMIEAAYAEKREIARTNVHMAELVAQARQQRLSTLDADAAATQARVEALEKERARLEAQGVPPAEAAAQAADNIAKTQR
uniref:hypothetical protein n=1 Tax=Altererythrobacter segetis TaxID=1104773 RepID=UPI0014094970|nr:hypothetical protein [Altererythrobacter segetis]